MPGIILTFILSNLLRTEGYAAIVAIGNEKIKEMANLQKKAEEINVQAKNVQDLDSKMEVVILEKTSVVAPGKGGGCGGGCGSRCGGGYGSGIKGGPINGGDIKRTGCDGCGGCGSGFSNDMKSIVGSGNDTKSSGCGGHGGCGGSCSNDIKSSARNGNDLKSSGCSGCGAMST